MLEERSGIPVVGVAPYLNIQVEDEDSLTERFETNRTVDLIDIAVIRVPRISNFTDFNPLESIQGVSLRYVKNPSELGNPDMIILPGTKNTMEDLLWMRENGLGSVDPEGGCERKADFWNLRRLSDDGAGGCSTLSMWRGTLNACPDWGCCPSVPACRERR